MLRQRGADASAADEAGVLRVNVSSRPVHRADDVWSPAFLDFTIPLSR